MRVVIETGSDGRFYADVGPLRAFCPAWRGSVGDAESGFELFDLAFAWIGLARTRRAVEGSRPVLEKRLLPLVEERRVDLRFVADGRDRPPLDEVEFEQLDLLLGGEVTGNRMARPSFTSETRGGLNDLWHKLHDTRIPSDNSAEAPR
jgi:hypothetical protein